MIRAVISSPSKYLSVGRLDPASLVRVGSISRLDVRALDTVPAWKKRKGVKKKKAGITKKQLPVLPAGYNIPSQKHHYTGSSKKMDGI